MKKSFTTSPKPSSKERQATSPVELDAHLDFDSSLLEGEARCVTGVMVPSSLFGEGSLEPGSHHLGDRRYTEVTLLSFSGHPSSAISTVSDVKGVQELTELAVIVQNFSTQLEKHISNPLANSQLIIKRQSPY